MREILFRGKRIDNGEWVQGYYFKIWHEHYICWGTTNGEVDKLLVIPGTIGQDTGFRDKNGKRIFRGDVLVFDGDRFVVLWDEERSGFRLDYWQFDEQYDFSYFWPTSEIIGNIHDNPEMMEVTE